MYELIAKNKRRSFVLTIVFSALVLGLGYGLSLYVRDGAALFAYVVIFNIISVLVSYYGGAAIVLASTGAQEVQKQEDPELFTVVENLAITAGIPMPRVYIIPDAALNAFATGRNPEHACVAITAGLRQQLTRSELEAVMGHELSHVKNFDTRLMMLTAVLFGMVTMIGNLAFRMAFHGRSRDRGRGNGALIGLLVVLVAAIVAPLTAQLIKLAISRQREYLADSSGVMLTRYPEALISALQKISGSPVLDGHHEATAHLFIYSPIQEQSFMQKLFSTHPPIADRIAALREGAHIHS